MNISLFPTPIYFLNVADTEDGANLSKAIDDTDIESVIDTNTVWDCKVDTGFFNFFKGIKLSYEVEKAAKSCIIPHIKNFIASTPTPNVDDLDVEIKNLWLNRYFKGYNQEAHNHIGHEISFNYVYKTTTPDTSFKFINMEIPSVADLWYVEEQLILSSKETVLDLQEGDLVIFPSFLYHSVFHKNENERITLSGNANITRVTGNRDEAR